jgi:TonB family protein
MRFIAASVLSLVFILGGALAQTIDVTSSPKTAKSPMYRPALLGSGPDSLINRIDTQGLIKAGQKDAAIMFSCSVTKAGQIVWSGTYRGTPGSERLSEEVLKRLNPATGIKFIPAIYNRQAVDVIFYGTVTFAVIDGKPRLRIFSNQEETELEIESDFIGPQPFFGGDSKFNGLHYPTRREAPVMVDGVVELHLDIDPDGTLKDIRLVSEKPPFLSFGDAALADFKKARFIPAFRKGAPVACQVTLPVYYKHMF